MNRSEYIVTEDVICELNLSPRTVPRVIGRAEKSSNSSIGHFENHPVMDLGNEFNGKNNKSSLVRDSSEAKLNNTENGMKTADEKPVFSIGDCAKKTDSFSHDPKSVTHLIEPSGSPEAIAGKDGITETLPRPRSSNRVLEMPPFTLSMEYIRSRDASPSLDDSSYRRSVDSSTHFSLEPFSHFSELNNDSLSESSSDGLNDISYHDGYFSLPKPTRSIKSSTLKSNSVSEEYTDHDLTKSLYHKNSTETPIEGFSILAEKTHISETSADGNIEKRTLNIVEAEGRSSFERSILDSENPNISYTPPGGKMETSTLSIVKVEDRTSIENAILNTENPDISYSSADGKMEKSTFSIVNVEDRASIQRIHSEKSYISYTGPSENTENSTVNVVEKDGTFIEHGSLHTAKPYVSYTLADSTTGKSSVNIVEVAENEISLPDTITSIDGNQHEICYPIITEEGFEEPPLNIPSVTIVELGNEDNLSTDVTKSNSASTVQPVDEIIYDVPAPTPRSRKPQEDLDESFVEWLQDHGFKVVDEGSASNNLEDKKKRLSWEFLFEDEFNMSDSNVDLGDRNIQTSSSNVCLTQNLKEKASENVGAIQQICKEKSCQVENPPEVLNNVYNDHEFEVPLTSLDQDLKDQFSSLAMHFEYKYTETEPNTVLNQPKSDTNESFIGNTLERITLPITKTSDGSNKSTRLVDNRTLSEKYFDENGLIIENTYLSKEYSVPELITTESKLAFSQEISTSVSLVGPNTEGGIDLSDRPMLPGINGNRIQEGSNDMEDLDVQYNMKEGPMKPSFILDAYEKESPLVESFDNSLISAAMDRYPEASWLTVESESAQESSSMSKEGKVIESQTSSFRVVDSSIDLHTIPQYSKNELQSVVKNDFEPDSLNSSYSVSLVGRKTWTVNEGTKFDPYDDETEVCVVASVDTLKRKIEEARRSSYSTGSERSDEEMEESSVKFEDEDFVFFRTESGMHSAGEEFRDQNAVVPAPPPRPSLSSERLDKETELSLTTTSYLETNLDLSSKSEGDGSSQKSPIPQQLIEHPQKIDPAKHEDDPKSLINDDLNKKRESAVDVPEECVCTCPKKSTHSPWTECPQFPETSHNVIDTEPKSSASSQDDIQPAEPISSGESPTVGPDRATLQCPHCKATVVTATVKKPSLVYGCCILPLFFDRMKDVEHWCPECQCFVGKYSWKPFQKIQ